MSHNSRFYNEALRRARDCGTKKQYSQKAAELAAASIRRFERSDLAEAYACEFCGHWHVGHRRP